MLRIYPVILEVLKDLQPVVRRVERADRDLARQLLASARETLACLEVAETCTYVTPLDATLHAQLNRVIGTLVKLVAA